MIENESTNDTLKGVFQNSPIAIGLYDSNGYLINCNQAELDLFGVSDINQVKHYNLFEEPNLTLAQRNEIKAGRNARYEVEYDFRNVKKLNLYQTSKSGIIYLDCFITSVKAKNNRIINYILYINDISAQKHLQFALKKEIKKHQKSEEALQERENLFRKLFNISPDAIFLVQENGKFFDANKVAVERYGYSHDEFLAMTPINLAVPNLKEKVPQKVKSALHQERHFEWVHCSKEGREFPVEIHSIPIIINDKFCIFVEVRDITERKLAEKELKESESKLRELNATKDKFFSIIAHDLKSPFSSILGCSELLSSGSHNYNEEQSKELIGYINSLAKQSITLLDNLLSWAKTQTGQINFKPDNFKLQPVVQEIVEVLNVIANRKNIILNNHVSNEIVVYADQNMLMTVLRNLISNAIKFTNTNGRINIYAISKQSQIEISVSDNGVGINENIRNNLFKIETTYTTKGTANEKGSGLGLLLCKEFIDKHGGQIWIESELGKGSDFKFTLPNN